MYFKRDYGLTEEQKDLQAMVHEFAEKEIKPRAAEWDVNGSFSDDVLEMAKEMGLHLMAVPEKFGGMGLDKVTECILREEIGWADAGFSVTLGGFALGFLPESPSHQNTVNMCGMNEYPSYFHVYQLRIPVYYDQP